MKNENLENKQLIMIENSHHAKAEGAFLASAAGDALGWPQEIRGKKIRPCEITTKADFSSWVRLAGGRFYRHEQEINAGEYSDDTQLLLAVARCRTLTTPSWWETFTRTELPLWSLYERGGGASTKRSVRSWLRGVPPWVDNGSRQLASYFNAGGNGVAMRVLPHAIYHAKEDDPTQLLRDIFLDGISTHGHPRALVGAVAHGFAAWWFLRSQRTIAFGEIIDVLLEEIDLWGVLPDLHDFDGSWTNAAAEAFRGSYGENWYKALEEMVALLNEVQTGLSSGAISDDEAVLRRIGAYGRTKGAGTITAAAALYLISRYAAQPVHGIVRAAFGYGTDTDTIAAMVGGLAGCMAGKDWIPQAWYRVQDCDYIRQLAIVVAKGQHKKTLQRELPVVVGHRQVNAIRRSLTTVKDPYLILDGNRRAKVVDVSQPQAVSRSSTLRTWSLHIDDGQTIYVSIQSRIPQRSQEMPIKDDNRNLSLHSKYVECMEEIKKRTSVIDGFLSGQCHALFVQITAESICLQIRKILELIALASLSASSSAYEKHRRNFRRDWNGQRILKTIEMANPRFYPKPTKQILDQTTGRVTPAEEIRSGFLTQGDYIRLYDTCGRILHADNPFSQKRDMQSFLESVPMWMQKITLLLNHHIIQLIDKGQQIWVVVEQNSDGQVHVHEFERIGEHQA